MRAAGAMKEEFSSISFAIKKLYCFEISSHHPLQPSSFFVEPTLGKRVYFS
jgi:hypothetical protein